MSLSVRRAWIEIDRLSQKISQQESLSVRRAWIEIAWRGGSRCCGGVALREESVD